ncbi:FAD-binding oxidoreductase [candidate division WOR-3 bacterium]|nr:FAD-binding oxidoreductase [candidate division WOR-3 bacterium]
MIIIAGSELSKSDPDLLFDESNMPGSWCDIVYMPETSEEVGEALKASSGKGVPVTVSSARTGLVGGALPFGGALLTFAKMKKSIEFFTEKKEIRSLVSSPVTLDELQVSAAKENAYFVPNPTESSASMGGIIATDASGSRSFKYGSAKKFVTGLKGYFFDGTFFDIKRGQHVLSDDFEMNVPGRGIIKLEGSFPRKMRKNNVGYNLWSNVDLIDVLCGNEGTLAVVTEAEIIMRKIPDFVFSGMFFFDETRKLLDFIKIFEAKMPEVLRSVEYLDSYSIEFLRKFYADRKELTAYLPVYNCDVLFADFEASDEDTDLFYEKLEETASETGIDMDKVFGGDTKKEAETVNNIRHSLPEAVNHRIKEIKREHPEIHKVGSDMSVPPDKTERLLSLFKESLGGSGLQYLIFGHVGDGHPHVNVIPKNPDELKKAKAIYSEIAKEVVSMGGSLSAEHGLGRLKKDYMKIMYDDKILKDMKRVKKAFDPENLLGRGVLFDEV